MRTAPVPSASNSCPNSGYYAEVTIENSDNVEYHKFRLRCKMWSCPYCSGVNARELREKSQNAIKSWIHENTPDGFRHGFQVKWLTLTLPGKRFRDKFSPDESEVIAKKNLSKLFNALKRKRGKFDYFWVVEKQKDGYPHFHVMLLGKAISGVDVLKDIAYLWVERYHMGFISLKHVKGGANGISAYMTKYMEKGLVTGLKGYRVYSMSKELRKKFKSNKTKRKVTVVAFGRIVNNLDGTETYQEIWSQQGETLYKNFDECVSFFERERLKMALSEMGLQLELPVKLK